MVSSGSLHRLYTAHPGEKRLDFYSFCEGVGVGCSEREQPTLPQTVTIQSNNGVQRVLF